MSKDKEKEDFGFERSKKDFIKYFIYGVLISTFVVSVLFGILILTLITVLK